MTVTRGTDIQEITSGKELPELQLTQSEIAAIKLTYLELVSKVNIDPLTGLEESGLDKITRKAYKIDPGMTKLLFGNEATRPFEIDTKTGVRSDKRTDPASKEQHMRDDLAAIEAGLNQFKFAGAQQGGAKQRSQTAPPPKAAAAEASPSTPAEGAATPPAKAEAAPKPTPKKATAAKRTASRQRRDIVKVLEEQRQPMQTLVATESMSVPLLDAAADVAPREGSGRQSLLTMPFEMNAQGIVSM